jgi:hypothetical protein
MMRSEPRFDRPVELLDYDQVHPRTVMSTSCSEYVNDDRPMLHHLPRGVFLEGVLPESIHRVSIELFTILADLIEHDFERGALLVERMDEQDLISDGLHHAVPEESAYLDLYSRP